MAQYLVESLPSSFFRDVLVWDVGQTISAHNSLYRRPGDKGDDLKMDLKAKWSKPLPVTGIGKPLDSSQDPSASLSHIWEGGARSGDSGDRDHEDLKKGCLVWDRNYIFPWWNIQK